ncbi:sensor histidine kinase [Lignipirellula cremea]|uniref:histidine kinase n=1 Tax=Lignipirellula cremea TaxID=2528010 RepID=A0A518DZG7_9BACT|nr:ATP-binding protein [Lignipirellula cremea]QDU97240.1 Phytochrome-like protein cph1 [Lignipirellula cremea]
MSRILVVHRQPYRIQPFFSPLAELGYDLTAVGDASSAERKMVGEEIVCLLAEANPAGIRFLRKMTALPQCAQSAAGLLVDTVDATSVLRCLEANADGMIALEQSPEEASEQLRKLIVRRQKRGMRVSQPPIHMKFREQEYQISTDRGQMLAVMVSAFEELSQVGERYAAEVQQRKQAETDLQESEARKQAIFEAALDCIVVIDNDGKIREFNLAAERKFGCSRSKVLGQDMAEFVAPASRGRYRDNLNRYTHAGEMGSMLGRRLELPMVQQDGESFIAEMAIQPFPMKGAAAFALFFHDVTDRHQAREREQRYNEELERSNRDLADFAYAASHDLQEPLRTVRSYCELIQKKYGENLDEKGSEFIESAVDAAGRMQMLLNDLLKYSRVSTRGEKFAAVDCNEACAIAIANLEIAIEESQANVTAESLPTVHGEPTLLMQLFQNLIGNALKFHRPDEPPQVTISAQRNGPQWEFSVADKGIGIPADQLEEVFTIFRRLHTREEYVGTGVGLAICKKIVERHHGRIWVESVEGEGAAFHFTLDPKHSQSN